MCAHVGKKNRNRSHIAKLLNLQYIDNGLTLIVRHAGMPLINQPVDFSISPLNFDCGIIIPIPENICVPVVPIYRYDTQ